MNIGFGLMGVSPRRYPLIVAKADELGFESCWQPEHLIWPAIMPPQYPYSGDGYPPVTTETPAFDPWVNLSFIASATTKLKLGTNVYILPLRDPFVTARAVGTLDYVSGGRVLFGCGVGWLEDEFNLTGLGFKNRGSRTDEIIEILKKLWTEDVTEFHGKHYDFGASQVPAQHSGPTTPADLDRWRLGGGPAAGRTVGRWLDVRRRGSGRGLRGKSQGVA